VRLVRGEALFDVAKDGARPFVVIAGGVAVQAVGTAFTVRLNPKAVDVLVTEGRVAVKRTTDDSGPDTDARDRVPASFPAAPLLRHSHTPIMLDAGKHVVVPVDAAPGRPLAPQQVSSDEAATALAWRNRRVEFNGTPLSEAVEIFNRDNSIQLSVADSRTGSLRITGVFWTNDPEAFSRVVETSLEISATRANDTKIVLRKQGGRPTSI
jgi:transmembrane sensor